MKHFDLRLPLDRYQIANVKQAQTETARAFTDTLQKLANHAFKTEHELANYLDYALKRNSPFGLSFPTIAAAGRNAAVLHYVKNDEPLPKKSLVLLDFGVRYGTLHADISRTLPINGRFNPLQKLLYEIVLDTLKLNQRHAIPGHTIRQLNQWTWEYLNEQLKKRFLDCGGHANRPYEKQPHGVSHLMGEQEHDGDPFKLYQDIPLRPGWQISNEPGIYGSFLWEYKGKIYSETLGIRIEDNLLIQSGKAINLSQMIPKEIVDLEKILQKKSPQKTKFSL